MKCKDGECLAMPGHYISAILVNDISSHVTNNNKLWKMIYLFSGKLVSLSIDWGFWSCVRVSGCWNKKNIYRKIPGLIPHLIQRNCCTSILGVFLYCSENAVTNNMTCKYKKIAEEKNLVKVIMSRLNVQKKYEADYGCIWLMRSRYKRKLES